MAEVRQFRQDSQIIHGTTAQTNAKLTDIMPLQHEDLATQTNQMKKISLGQCLCEPYAVCNSNNPANGAYVADCVNFPDFTLQFTDGQGNNHSLIGLKVRVLFNYGITYGSVSGGTYPTLNINGSGAIPLLAQGKTMGAGAISAGQTVEFTIIPYGNSLAFDADSNVRESNSDYTLHTDGSITYSKNYIDGNTAIKANTRDLDSLFMNKAGFSFLIENSSPANFAGLPTISDYDTAGGGIGVELIQFRTNARGYQLLTVNYYSTSGNWQTIIYGRTLIDSSIFPWHELHRYGV